MTFSYTYYDDEEIERMRNKLNPDTYNFEVTDATEGHSKTTGNPMITLDLAVFDHQGNKHQIRDYLVGNSGGAFKIRAFWKSVGHPEKYNSQAAVEASDFVGKCGKVKTKLEKGDDGIREFPRVAFYVEKNSKESNSPKPAIPEETIKTSGDEDFLDDVPF